MGKPDGLFPCVKSTFKPYRRSRFGPDVFAAHPRGFERDMTELATTLGVPAVLADDAAAHASDDELDEDDERTYRSVVGMRSQSSVGSGIGHDRMPVSRDEAREQAALHSRGTLFSRSHGSHRSEHVEAHANPSVEFPTVQGARQSIPGMGLGLPGASPPPPSSSEFDPPHHPWVTASPSRSGGTVRSLRPGPIPDEQYRAKTAERTRRAGAPSGTIHSSAPGTVPRTPNGRPVYHFAGYNGGDLTTSKTTGSKGRSRIRRPSTSGAAGIGAGGQNSVGVGIDPAAWDLGFFQSASQPEVVAGAYAAAAASSGGAGKAGATLGRRPVMSHRYTTSPQPGQGPYLPDSVAARSVAVQAAPAPHRRFYLPKEHAATGVVNSFYHHFDVLDTDAPPEGVPELPQSSFLRCPAPEYLDAAYNRFYHAALSGTAAGAVEAVVPKVRMSVDGIQDGGYRSKDLRESSVRREGNEPESTAIELHELVQYVGRVRPRGFDDTVPLLQLTQGLLLYTSDELMDLVARREKEREDLMDRVAKETSETLKKASAKNEMRSKMVASTHVLHVDTLRKQIVKKEDEIETGMKVENVLMARLRKKNIEKLGMRWATRARDVVADRKKEAELSAAKTEAAVKAEAKAGLAALAAAEEKLLKTSAEARDLERRLAERDDEVSRMASTVSELVADNAALRESVKAMEHSDKHLQQAQAAQAEMARLKRSVDGKMKRREAEIREVAREEMLMKIAEVQREAMSSKEVMFKKASSAKMQGLMAELSKQSAVSAKKAAEARWRDEKAYAMEMEEKVRELKATLQASEMQAEKERAAAAKKVSEANVKVARLMGDLASGGGGGGGGEAGLANEYFQNLAADLSAEMSELSQALEASEEALFGKMQELETERRAAAAAAAKRKVASAAKYLVMEMKADAKLSAAERKLADKEEEVAALVRSLHEVKGSLGEAAEASAEVLAASQSRASAIAAQSDELSHAVAYGRAASFEAAAAATTVMEEAAGKVPAAVADPAASGADAPAAPVEHAGPEIRNGGAGASDETETDTVPSLGASGDRVSQRFETALLAKCGSIAAFSAGGRFVPRHVRQALELLEKSPESLGSVPMPVLRDAMTLVEPEEAARILTDAERPEAAAAVMAEMLSDAAGGEEGDGSENFEGEFAVDDDCGDAVRGILDAMAPATALEVMAEMGKMTEEEDVSLRGPSKGIRMLIKAFFVMSPPALAGVAGVAAADRPQLLADVLAAADDRLLQNVVDAVVAGAPASGAAEATVLDLLRGSNMKPPLAARVVTAIGAVRAASVIQVLGASGSSRLIGAMEPSSAAAALYGVGSPSFVADVVVKITDVDRAADLFPALVALSPEFVAEVISIVATPSEGSPGGGAAEAEERANALAAVVSAMNTDDLPEAMGVVWQHLDVIEAAQFASRMTARAAAEALAGCEDLRVASRVVTGMPPPKAGPLMCQLVRASLTEIAVAFLDLMPPAVAVETLQEMSTSSPDGRTDARDAAAAVACKAEVHAAAAAAWMVQLGAPIAMRVLEDGSLLTPAARGALTEFANASPLKLFEQDDAGARHAAMLAKKEDELAALRLAVASFDAAQRRESSDRHREFEEKVRRMVSDAMRAKAETQLAASLDAMAAASEELERARSALAEAEARGAKAELRAFEMAVAAATRRKKSEEAVAKLTRRETQLEAEVEALRVELRAIEREKERGEHASPMMMSAESAAVSAMKASSSRHANAEYDAEYVEMVLKDPAAIRKAESLKESFVCALADSVLRYLHNTLGCEGALGRICYDPAFDIDDDSVDNPDTYDDNVMQPLCLTTNHASALFVGNNGYFTQDPTSLPYVAANTLETQTGPSPAAPDMEMVAAPVVLPEDCPLKTYGSCWGVIVIAFSRAAAERSEDTRRAIDSAKSSLHALTLRVAELVAVSMRAEMRESEALLTDALRKADSVIVPQPSMSHRNSSRDKVALAEKVVTQSFRAEDVEEAERNLQATNAASLRMTLSQNRSRRRSRVSTTSEMSAISEDEAPKGPVHRFTDMPARELFELREGTWRDAINSVNDDGDPIDTSPLNYKESVAIADVCRSRSTSAVSAIERSTSLKAQLSELRRYSKVSRVVVGIICVALTMIGEDVSHLLSDAGGKKLIPRHPQKLLACWSQVKKMIKMLRTGPGIMDAPFTTRMLRWRPEEFLALGKDSVDMVFSMMDSLGLTEQEVKHQSVAIKLVYCWISASLVQLEMIDAVKFYDKQGGWIDGKPPSEKIAS